MKYFHFGDYEKGVGLMLLYAFAMSLLSLFSKIVLTDNDLFLFLFSRYFLTLLAMLPFLYKMGVFKEIELGKNLLPMIYRAGIAMLSLNLFFYCLINTSLFNSTVLYNTGPIFIPILAKCLFKAPIDRRVWWSISISFIGVLLVMKPDVGIFSIYSLAGVLAGFFMAISSLMYARASAGGGRISLGSFYFLLLASAFSILLLLGFNGLYKKDLGVIVTEFFQMPWQGWAALFATVFCLIVNQTARGYAFRFAPVEKLAPFMYSIVIFSGIFDWAVFHNPPDLFSLIGACLVIAGVFLELYFQKTIKIDGPSA